MSDRDLVEMLAERGMSVFPSRVGEESGIHLELLRDLAHFARIWWLLVVTGVMTALLAMLLRMRPR